MLEEQGESKKQEEEVWFSEDAVVNLMKQVIENRYRNIPESLEKREIRLLIIESEMGLAKAFIGKAKQEGTGLVGPLKI